MCVCMHVCMHMPEAKKESFPLRHNMCMQRTVEGECHLRYDMYVCMYACMHVCMYVKNVYARIFGQMMSSYIHTYIHTCNISQFGGNDHKYEEDRQIIKTYMHTYIHTHTYTYMHAYAVR